MKKGPVDKRKSVALITLGCRLNFFDTEFIKNLFLKKGNYEIIEDSHSPSKYADIYIINTCTVTSGADRDSRKAIYKAKRINPNAIIVATGCYAQVQPENLANLPEVDLVIGNTHKTQIVEIVEKFQKGEIKEKIFVDNIFKEKVLRNFDTIVSFTRSRPFLKVQEGCNSFCSFCVIPYARGKVRSVPLEKIVETVKKLADMGYKEIVLTGTQLSQYGKDLNLSLAQLLKELIKIEGVEYFRLSSMSVAEISPELMEIITSSEKIAPHFHLSLQSGDNEILRKMNRNYTVEEFEEKVWEILDKRKISAIGTDIIVGFPTEGEREFQNTYEVLKRIPFAYFHIFPYSDRPFTKARLLFPKVPKEVIKERVKILQKLEEEKRRAFREKMKGIPLRAIFLKSGELLTENYITVKTSSVEILKKEPLTIKIIS
jgi:threonylcarbamoyladenosine tRNA methylthiotransferase MtaB